MSPNVTRWSPVVISELGKAGIPLPLELVLSLISVESGGVSGKVNIKSGASGLLQVMPITLQDYNKHHKIKISLSVLRDKNDGAGAEQIRVGLWALEVFWRGSYNYLVKRLDTVPIDQIARIADLFYVAGPGATRERLDTLSVPTFEHVAVKYPTWNALPHPLKVWSRTSEQNPIWRLDDISTWLHGGISDSLKRNPKVAAAIALLAVGVAAWYLKGKGHGQK